jgi:hypothetical protein
MNQVESRGDVFLRNGCFVFSGLTRSYISQKSEVLTSHHCELYEVVSEVNLAVFYSG